MNKDSASKIFSAALGAVNPLNALSDNIQLKNSTLLIGSNEIKGVSYNLDCFKRICVVGCGKAVWPMSLALEKILGDRITGGLAITKYGHVSSPSTSIIQIKEANHPFPDYNGYAATLETIRILEMAESKDLIIALISGGGSSLWAMPVPKVSLEELQKTTQMLIGCGANISEINAVRKHISAIAGGFAACRAFPASVLVLAISDVIGDNLDTIASGPFYPDETSFLDAINVLKHFGIYDNIAPAVRNYLVEGNRGLQYETPKRDSACFKNVYHHIIASNKSALLAAKQRAQDLGYLTIVIEKPICGEARTAAIAFCNKVKEFSDNLISDKICIIEGGEATVTLGNAVGKGGRNQEFALAAAVEIAGMTGVTILSCGTDGTDGNTDADGAIVNGDTIELCQKAGLDTYASLNEHDSYTLFEQSGNLIKTGPTFTNVMDLVIALIEK